MKFNCHLEMSFRKLILPGCPKLNEPAPKLPAKTQQSIRAGDCLGAGTKSFAHITSMSHLHPLPLVDSSRPAKLVLWGQARGGLQPCMGCPLCPGICSVHGTGCFLHWKDPALSKCALLHGIKAILLCFLLSSITNYKNKQGHGANTVKLRH